MVNDAAGMRVGMPVVTLKEMVMGMPGGRLVSMLIRMLMGKPARVLLRREQVNKDPFYVLPR